MLGEYVFHQQVGLQLVLKSIAQLMNVEAATLRRSLLKAKTVLRGKESTGNWKIYFSSFRITLYGGGLLSKPEEKIHFSAPWKCWHKCNLMRIPKFEHLLVGCNISSRARKIATFSLEKLTSWRNAYFSKFNMRSVVKLKSRYRLCNVASWFEIVVPLIER